MLQSITVMICMVLIKNGDRHWSVVNLPAVFVMSNLWMILINLIPARVKFEGRDILNDGMKLIRIPFISKDEIKRLINSGELVEALDSLAKKDYKKAVKEFEKSINGIEESEPISINYSVCLMRCMEIDKARQVLLNLIDNYHDSKYASTIYNNQFLINFKIVIDIM